MSTFNPEDFPDNFPDFMVDIETMGTRPDRNHIIEIAIVPFNHKTGAVSKRVFNRCLSPSPYRQTDLDTIKWWNGDPERKAHLAHIHQRLDPIPDVLKALTEFVYNTPRESEAHFWGNTAGFDWLFLQGYFKDYAEVWPFNYWNQFELKSYMQGLTGLPWEKVEKPTRQFAHSAVHDCLYQIGIIQLHSGQAKDTAKLHETIADLRKSLHTLKQANVPMPKRVEYDPATMDDDLPF